MIQTDNAKPDRTAGDDYDRQVGENVRAALQQAGFSVNGAAGESGIAYATLDRKLKGITSFTVSELNRLAAITSREESDFLPARSAA